MSKLLITYGLNPLSGIRLLSKGSWRTLAQLLRHHKVQVSLGAMIPERATGLERLRQLQLFIALEATPPTPKSLPLLGSPTGLQIYEQHQGSRTYKTEVVRFSLGKERRRRLPAGDDMDRGTGTDLAIYR
ncbi:MAG: hypothetical protein Q6K08_04965 [Thermostichales cyanobacterium GMQP_bins_62]